VGVDTVAETNGTAATGDAHWETFNAALLNAMWYGKAVVLSRLAVAVVAVVT
jgi:hypothetical protein